MQAAAKNTTGRSISAASRMLWRGGCIIRARFLERIKEAFDADQNLENLLLAPYFTPGAGKSPSRLAARRRHRRASWAFRMPAFTTALAYYDGIRQQPLAGQPAASPARLFRRPHLRAHRQAGHVPQRLAASCGAQIRNDSSRLAQPIKSSIADDHTDVRIYLENIVRPRRPGGRRHRRHRRAGRRAVRRVAQAGAHVGRRRPRRRARRRARSRRSRSSAARRTFCRSMSPSASRSKTLLAATLKQFGRVDILVNCAGVNSASPYLEATRRRLEPRHRDRT